jgi:hypothetical protein
MPTQDKVKRTRVMNGIVISLCDYTGNIVLPWAESGMECHCYDLRPKYPSFERVGAGVIYHHVLNVVAAPRSAYPQRWDFGFAFPPCTDLAVSGARHFKGKGLRSLIEALEVVEACRDLLESGEAPWMLENPISTLSTYWREPDYAFDPYEYSGYTGGESDTYTKKTCLWTGGGFLMPAKQALGLGPLFDEKPVKIDDRIHRMPPSEERGNLRSVTPMGFARAVFEANAVAATQENS